MNNEAMFKISYGLFVLSSADGEKDNACITNTVAQVTAEPNRISVAVNKANYTCEMIEKSGKIGVSIISEDADFELFKRFGFQSGRDTDKFADFSAVKRSENGTLVVTEGTNAYLNAAVASKVDLGSHLLFIADVTDGDVITKVPSATYDYYFKHIKPAPEKVGETNDGKTIWRCKICGYEYVGEELPADFICPLCKHPASDFEKVVQGGEKAEAAQAAKAEGGKRIWRCPLCGYEYEGDDLPPDYECPLCLCPGSDFELVNN